MIETDSADVIATLSTWLRNFSFSRGTKLAFPSSALAQGEGEYFPFLLTRRPSLSAFLRRPDLGKEGA